MSSIKLFFVLQSPRREVEIKRLTRREKLVPIDAHEVKMTSAPA